MTEDNQRLKRTQNVVETKQNKFGEKQKRTKLKGT